MNHHVPRETRLTLYALRRPNRITVTRARTSGEWIITAYGHRSRWFPTFAEAIETADHMAWAVLAMRQRTAIMASDLL